MPETSLGHYTQRVELKKPVLSGLNSKLTSSNLKVYIKLSKEQYKEIQISQVFEVPCVFTP